jgi:hypothetical protein
MARKIRLASEEIEMADKALTVWLSSARRRLMSQSMMQPKDVEPTTRIRRMLLEREEALEELGQLVSRMQARNAKPSSIITAARAMLLERGFDLLVSQLDAGHP